MGGWITNDFEDLNDIKLSASGSKVVFKRTMTAFGRTTASYLHTGVLLRIGGEDYIAELVKTDRKMRITLTNWKGFSDDVCYIDNTCLKERQVNINDILYRLSSHRGASILRCDVSMQFMLSI